VDTHADVHVAAAGDQLGSVLGTESFPATPRGYRSLHGYLREFGPVSKVGVEGTGAYAPFRVRLGADRRRPTTCT
jgi:transposase